MESCVGCAVIGIGVESWVGGELLVIVVGSCVEVGELGNEGKEIESWVDAGGEILS